MKTMIVILWCSIGILALGCGGDEAESFGPFESCLKLQTDFEACGGELSGTWEACQACIEMSATKLPHAENCNNSSFEYDIEVTDAVTFDGSIATWTEANWTVTGDALLPLNCFPLDADIIQISGCEDYQTLVLDKYLDKETSGNASCDESGQRCECEITYTQSVEASEQTYQIENNQLKVIDALASYPFCIKEDYLVLKFGGNDWGVEYMIYKKK